MAHNQRSNGEGVGPTTRESLIQSAGRGGLWQVSGGGATTLIRIAASTILARLLTPADYGVFGIAILVREFVSNMGALGMGIGIIAKSHVTEEDLSTCFWTVASTRVLMFLALFAGAPLAGSFFQNDHVVPVIRFVSISYLVSIAGIMPYILLRKNFKFFQATSIDVVGVFFESIVAVVLAVKYMSNYWALVFSTISASIVVNILLFFSVRWFPAFRFDKTSFRYLFRFGANGLGVSLIEYFHQNIDYLLVGRLLGPRALGMYEFAYRIPHLLHSRLAAPLRGVMLPALSRLQHDNTLMMVGYIKAVRHLTLFTFPLLGGLAVVADLTVWVLWGPQWMGIIVPLQILCLSSAIRITTDSLRCVFNCKDRPDIPFKYGLLTFGLTLGFVYALGSLYGLSGVATGMLLSTFPSLYLTKLAFRLTNVPVTWLLKGLWPSVAGTIGCMAAALFMRWFSESAGSPEWMTLLLCILSGGAVYGLVLAVFFRRTTEEIMESAALVFDFGNKDRLGVKSNTG